jgi:hypothetical protein
VFSEDCEERVECDDDGGTGVDSRITRYFSTWDDIIIVIDGFSRNSRGDFILSIIEGYAGHDTGYDHDTGGFVATEETEEMEETDALESPATAICSCTPDDPVPEVCEAW